VPKTLRLTDNSYKADKHEAPFRADNVTQFQGQRKISKSDMFNATLWEHVLVNNNSFIWISPVFPEQTSSKCIWEVMLTPTFVLFCV